MDGFSQKLYGGDWMNLELGAGVKGTPGYTHHDRWKHSPEIDIAFDLEQIPWPLGSSTVDNLLAIDVFEHLKPWVVDVPTWMAECWRVLKPSGLLVFRVPHFQNHYSWRDITHYRVFHPESFHYFCPDAPGTVWENFGKYYFGKNYHQWWSWKGVVVEANDLKFTLMKVETA